MIGLNPRIADRSVGHLPRLTNLPDPPIVVAMLWPGSKFGKFATVQNTFLAATMGKPLPASAGGHRRVQRPGERNGPNGIDSPSDSTVLPCRSRRDWGRVPGQRTFGPRSTTGGVRIYGEAVPSEKPKVTQVTAGRSVPAGRVCNRLPTGNLRPPGDDPSTTVQENGSWGPRAKSARFGPAHRPRVCSRKREGNPPRPLVPRPLRSGGGSPCAGPPVPAKS